MLCTKKKHIETQILQGHRVFQTAVRFLQKLQKDFLANRIWLR